MEKDGKLSSLLERLKDCNISHFKKNFIIAGPKTVTKEEVLAHESEWYSNDEYGWICDDPYFVWYYPKKEVKEEPQEDKSCGTSLADLLKKSGF